MNFDFMEPPDRVRLVKSLRLLFLIGALDADGKLTPLGEQLVFVLVLGFPRFKFSKVYIEAFHVEGVGARPIGERISQLPLEPQYGRVLVAAAELGCVSEALMLVMFSLSSDVFIGCHL